MKKIILLFVFALVSIITYSQELPVDSITKKFTYEGVVAAEGLSKSDLYSRALEWFALEYKSSNDVIQLKDEATGKIIGKGFFTVKYYFRDPSIYHTIQISVKDNKFKYVITDLFYKDSQKDTFPLEQFPSTWMGKKKLYTTVDTEVKKVIEDLKISLTKPKKVDNW